MYVHYPFISFHSSPHYILIVTQELSGLSALEYQMSRNLEALRDKYEHAQFARTLKGRLWIFGGRVFMVYCILRGCSVGHSIASYSYLFIYFNSRYTILSFSTLSASRQLRIQILYRTYSLGSLREFLPRIRA